MNKINILIFCIVFLISCEKPVDVDLSNKENLEKVIESEFIINNCPGISYIVVKEDSVIFSGAKGFANIENKIPFTTDTRMMIASISKTMLPVAIMQLSEKGLIKIDHDINNYLPFRVKNPTFPEDSITVKMLLTHHSSITDAAYDITSFYIFGYNDYPQPLGEFLEDYLIDGGQYYSEKTFDKYKPGAQYSYSNICAGLLGYIVEYISQTDYRDYCQQNIFTPLGMTRTSFYYSQTPIEEIATQYGDMNFQNNCDKFLTYPDYPSGHLITTVTDLSKFMRAFLSDGEFNNYKLLTPESVNLVLTEHFNEVNLKQGLIFYNLDFNEFNLWGHSGGDPGMSTNMGFDLQNKLGFIVFINRTDVYPQTLYYSLLKYAKSFNL